MAMFAAGSGTPMAKGVDGAAEATADALGEADVVVEVGAASLLQAPVTTSAAAPRRDKL